MSGRAAARQAQALSDETLMTLIRDQDDTRAFEAFYDRHAGLAFSLATRILNDRDLAADATQEAFAGLWRGRARYDPARSAGRAWLLRMVRNRALDVWRREHGQRVDLPGDDGWLALEPASDCVEQEVLANDERHQLDALLSKLPPTQRRVIELAYFRGLTHTEIAQQLGLPLGTARGRMRLGLDKLRVALKDAQPRRQAKPALGGGVS